MNQKKTRFLCLWCHRLHTKKQIEENYKKDEDEYKYSLEEENEIIDLNNSKICKGPMCLGKRRNLNKFYKSKNKLSYNCKKCFLYDCLKKRRYLANIIDNKKLEIGNCNKCKKEVTKDTLCCFDFDHIIMKGKKMNVGRIRCLQSIDSNILKEELKKCQLLCCSCHKKKTMIDLGYKKLDPNRRILNKEKKVYNCQTCNNIISKKSKLCKKCYKQNKIFKENKIITRKLNDKNNRYTIRDRS